MRPSAIQRGRPVYVYTLHGRPPWLSVFEKYTLLMRIAETRPPHHMVQPLSSNSSRSLITRLKKTGKDRLVVVGGRAGGAYLDLKARGDSERGGTKHAVAQRQP